MASPPRVQGIELDSQTRCAHWHSPLDVIAIKMFCCGEYYACKDCHAALAGHPLEVWPLERWDEPAVLCGVCQAELTVQQYLDANSHCPNCHAAFNPRCALHYADYFAVVASKP